MKKSTFYALVYFTLIFMAASMMSCSSTQHGYDYKAHAKRNSRGSNRNQSCGDSFRPKIKENYNSHGTNWY